VCDSGTIILRPLSESQCPGPSHGANLNLNMVGVSVFTVSLSERPRPLRPVLDSVPVAGCQSRSSVRLRVMFRFTGKDSTGSGRSGSDPAPAVYSRCWDSPAPGPAAPPPGGSPSHCQPQWQSGARTARGPGAAGQLPVLARGTVTWTLGVARSTSTLASDRDLPQAAQVQVGGGPGSREPRDWPSQSAVTVLVLVALGTCVLSLPVSEPEGRELPLPVPP
jgi:hypothetical protein